MSAPPLKDDLRAGFTGLLVAAVLLLAAIVTIVHLTNLKFEGHAAPAAGQQAPAGH
jgi:hypothetical protein